jgi:WD40 repeat protein
VRFSPDESKLAVASHDNLIDIYRPASGQAGDWCSGPVLAGTCRGHSSFITHIDWSADSAVLQSNSGDYELLYVLLPSVASPFSLCRFVTFSRSRFLTLCLNINRPCSSSAYFSFFLGTGMRHPAAS